MSVAAKKRRRAGRRRHYTVVLKGYGNEWYPNEPAGHYFHEISRGAFPTKTAAREWARAHLGGGKYRVRAVY